MTQLIDMVQKKIQWLTQQTHLKSMNIGNSQVPGAQGKELKSFGEFMKTSKNQSSSQLDISARDVKETGREISVEWESFDLTKASMDHQATLSLLKKYLGMVKNVIGKT